MHSFDFEERAFTKEKIHSTVIMKHISFWVKCNVKVDRFMCSASGMLLLKLKKVCLEMAVTTSIFDQNIPTFYPT